MQNQPKNVPKPPTKPKFKKLKFAIIAIFSAFFVIWFALWLAYGLYFGLFSPIATIDLEFRDLNAWLARWEVHNYFSENGDYIRILPNGETMLVTISANVFTRSGRQRPLGNTFNEVITWQVDGLLRRPTLGSPEGDFYDITWRMHADVFFSINLTQEYREIKIRVSDTHNAEIYENFTIIIDPNMTSPPRN